MFATGRFVRLLRDSHSIPRAVCVIRRQFSLSIYPQRGA
jgi:hypothetical protein